MKRARAAAILVKVIILFLLSFTLLLLSYPTLIPFLLPYLLPSQKRRRQTKGVLYTSLELSLILFYLKVCLRVLLYLLYSTLN